MFNDKISLRKQLLSKRSSLSKEKIDSKSYTIAENLFTLPEIQAASKIACYLSFDHEVSTHELVSKLILAGKEVFVPFMSSGEIEFAKFISFSDVILGEHNIPEPVNRNSIDCAVLDVFIIPGVGFDLKGNRIGWGKGYYDKFFNEKRLKKPKIGVCFDFQIVKNITHEKHDVTLDAIVSEKRILYFDKN